MDNYGKLTKLIHDRIKKDPTTAARVIVGLCQTINAEFTHNSVDEAEKVFKEEWTGAELISNMPINDKITITKNFYKYRMYNETLRMNLYGNGYYKTLHDCRKIIFSKNPGYDVVSIKKTELTKEFVNG